MATPLVKFQRNKNLLLLSFFNRSQCHAIISTNSSSFREHSEFNVKIIHGKYDADKVLSNRYLHGTTSELNVLIWFPPK